MIMNEVDWKENGEVGCLASLVKITAATIVLVAVTIFAYHTLAPVVVNLWW